MMKDEDNQLSRKSTHRPNLWPSRSKWRCGVILLLLLICFDTSNAAETVTLQLAWKHQFQFAGYYAALQQNFYGQVGLDVAIIEGGEGKFAREAVLQGRAQYGVAGAELLLHRRDGNPFVVLAPIFQHSPSILLARRDAGIATIQDLVGKRVMLLPGKKDADILAAFLNEGVPLDAFHRLDQTYDLDDLIQGRTDAVSAYVTNEPWQLLQQGIEPAVISPRTSGVDFYSDCLFTTEAEIRKHPRQVQAFFGCVTAGLGICHGPYSGNHRSAYHRVWCEKTSGSSVLRGGSHPGNDASRPGANRAYESGQMAAYRRGLPETGASECRFFTGWVFV